MLPESYETHFALWRDVLCKAVSPGALLQLYEVELSDADKNTREDCLDALMKQFAQSGYVSTDLKSLATKQPTAVMTAVGKPVGFSPEESLVPFLSLLNFNSTNFCLTVSLGLGSSMFLEIIFFSKFNN